MITLQTFHCKTHKRCMTNKTGAARTPTASKCPTAMTLMNELSANTVSLATCCVKYYTSVWLYSGWTWMEIQDYSHWQRITKPLASESRLVHPTLHLLMYIVLFPTSERKVITDTKVFYCRKAAKVSDFFALDKQCLRNEAVFSTHGQCCNLQRTQHFLILPVCLQKGQR